MANVVRPIGLRPVRMTSGQAFHGGMTKMYAGENLFMGDPVFGATGGTASNDGAYQKVTRTTSATAGVVLGVVVGWEPDPDNLGRLFHASSTTIPVYVATDPQIVWEIQGDGAGSDAITEADVGLNADFAIAAGSTSTGASNIELDESTTGATAIDSPLHIVGLSATPDNDIASVNKKILVRLNMHAYGDVGGTTTGI